MENKIVLKEGERPLILVTNDDGIEAKGLASLVEYLLPLGDVVVVAPDGPRSGQSAAITAGVPLRLSAVANRPGYRAFKTTGTPVDCVKLAFNVVLERRPDLLVSGINHGSNAGVSVLYSGTMGAVFEGVLQGIPSIGFSLCDFSSKADFSVCRPLIELLCSQAIALGLPAGIGLNVNIPAVEHLKGARICRAAKGLWTEEYESRIDPHGHPYYWLTGHFVNAEPDAADTDEYLLANGYASVVPVTPDRTVVLEQQHHLRALLAKDIPMIE